eukprot:gene10952-3024_t
MSDNDSEWEDLLGTGAVLKRILEPGKGTKTRPTRGSQACITASCTVNGEIRFEKQNFAFEIGESEHHAVFDIVVPLMEEGEHAIIKPEKRFVSFSDVNDEDEVLFEIKLRSWEEATPEELWTDEQRLAFAGKKREQGRARFESNDLETALIHYKRAACILTSSSDGCTIPEDKQIKEACLPLWNNMALIFLKLKEYSHARDKCDLVLAVDPNNKKGLFRKAKALLSLSQLDEAEKIAKQGSEVDSKLFQPLLRAICTEKKKEKSEQQLLYERMMTAMRDEDKDMSQEETQVWRQRHLTRDDRRDKGATSSKGEKNDKWYRVMLCLLMLVPVWLVASPQDGGLITKQVLMLYVAYIVYVERVCYRCFLFFLLSIALLCSSGSCHLCPHGVPCEPCTVLV